MFIAEDQELQRKGCLTPCASGYKIPGRSGNTVVFGSRISCIYNGIDLLSSNWTRQTKNILFYLFFWWQKKALRFNSREKGEFISHVKM